MKILMLNPFSATAAVRQINLAKALCKRGNKVTLVLPLFDKYSDYKEVRVEKVKNLRVIHPKQFKSQRLELSMLPYVPSAMKKVMKHKYDIVHSFRPTPFSGLIGEKIAQKQCIPSILEMGDLEWQTMKALGTHPNYRIQVMQKLEKWLVSYASNIVIMNSNVGSYLIENYSGTTDEEYEALWRSINLIPNGVDCSKFKPTKTKEFSNNKILMFCGKLDHVSHITDMIKVMQKLDNKYRLYIIGDGEKKEVLVKLAEGLGVIDKVVFLGKVDNDKVPDTLNLADVLIAPFSNEEGVQYASNLKVFEYMAMGKPIVASNVGKMEDILFDCGYLYEPGNIKEMAKLIKKADKSIGKKARAKALKEYDWKVLGKQLEEVYKEMI